MKYLTHILAFLLLIGCGDNAYDGETGLISAKSLEDAPLESLRTTALIGFADDALGKLESLEANLTLLETAPSAARLESSRTAFLAYLPAWKKVESVYMLGNLDETYTDLPRYLDYFHVGNEDVPAQLDAIFASEGDLETQLFKNSQKSVNAIEYTLFGDGADAEDIRRTRALQLMVAAQKTHLSTILSAYENDELFVSRGSDSVSDLINVLIDSAYKLKEWRLGDPAGFTVKYKDDPDASRLEYPYSRTSLAAIRAILEAHKTVMEQGLLTLAEQGSAAAEGAESLLRIEEALAACDNLQGSLADNLEGADIQLLYTAVDNLYDSYYLSLINALNFSAKIIEADGD